MENSDIDVSESPTGSRDIQLSTMQILQNLLEKKNVCTVEHLREKNNLTNLSLERDKR